MSTPERIQKIIAQAGLASRREAETLISEGLVTVNGKTAKLGDKATLGEDAIKVKGKLIHNAENKVYYLFYKPKNVIAMINEDEEGRPTIKEFTRGIKERVFTVGRMDFAGEGAILLTNDGEIAQKITKSDDLLRRYHVKVDRHPTAEDLARLARGGRIEKVSMNPHHIRVVQEYAKNALIEVSFQGSGVTEIRKFFENKGFFPEKVVRVGIGHLKADKMKPGEIKSVDASSIQALFAQPELAEKLIDNIVKSKANNFKVIDGKEQIDYTAKNFTEKKYGDKKYSDKKSDKRDFSSEKKPFAKKKRDFVSVTQRDDTDSSARPSRRPPRGRPLPAERAAGIKRSPRGDMPTPRFKSEGPARGGRPSFGDRAPRGDRPSFGRGAPRGGSDRPAFGERKSFGDRKPFGERKSFSDRAPRGSVRGGGDRPSFGDRAPRGDRPSFGRGAPRGGSDRPAFGERKSFGDRKPFGERKSFGDRKPFGERKSFGDRPSFGGDRARGDRPVRSDRPAFGERKSFGRGAPRGGGGDRPSRGGFQPRFKRS